MLVSDFTNRVRNYINSNTQGRVEDSDIRDYINEWFRFTRTRYLLPWSERTTELMVFPGVFNYAAPSDFVTAKPPQRQISADINDDTAFHSTTQKEFARNRFSTNFFDVTWERETKYLQVRYIQTVGEQIAHTMDTVTDNGTWAVGGDGSGLVSDTGIFREGSASLRFNVTNSSKSTTLTISDMTAINLSASTSTVTNPDFKNNSYVFFWVYLPVTGMTSAAIRWGSSSSDYYSASATTNYDGSAFRVGWNLIGVAWPTSDTGTPDDTAINYLLVTLTGAATGNGYRVDHITFKKWVNLDLHYYSNQLAKNNAGTYIESVSANDDEILGDLDFIEGAIYFVGKSCAEYKLSDATMRAIFEPKLQYALRQLDRRYPSQEFKVSSSYINRGLERG